MPPPVELRLLIDAVFVLAGALLLLALTLLVERGISAVQTSRACRQEVVLTGLLHQALQGTPGIIHVGALSKFDLRLVRAILLRLAPDLRGEAGDAIAELYQRLGFLQGDLQRLGSWRAMTRANAAADLGVAGAAQAVPALTRSLSDPDVRVRQAAVWALGQTGNSATFTGMVRLLGDPSISVARRAQEVLAERGQEVKEAILAYAATSANRAGRVAAIELIGWLRIPEGAELLLDCVSDLDPEIRVKAVKAAAAVGDPRFLHAFHRLLTDVRWEVRCQAAKGLTVFGSSDSVPLLERALQDQHWWVRLYAATALSECGPLGQAVLQNALDDPNAPVRTMARYLLERGTVVPALP
jgi:HEAT repeat protein